MQPLIQLDGSRGEGGGQILRSALALSVITGKAFEMVKIRAGRSKPGLRNQHLTCVLAAQAISAAEVVGAELDSQELLFEPQTLVGGTYHFEQPGAGSAMLVLQTVLMPLLLADTPSRLTLTGGTHNPLAPPFDFIERSFVPCLRKMGADISLTLDQAGFFPAGGGKCRVEIQPVGSLQPLHLSPETGVQRHQGKVLIANLPEHIAERELKALKGSPWERAEIVYLKSRGPGNLILLESQSEQLCTIHEGFGEKKLPAEQVVQKLLSRAMHHFKSKLSVEEYLADQLLLPMALAGGGSFYTSELSQHTRTNIETIQTFLDISIQVKTYGKGWHIHLG